MGTILNTYVYVCGTHIHNDDIVQITHRYDVHIRMYMKDVYIVSVHMSVGMCVHVHACAR